MNAKKYYSLRELSQELDIPKSTIVKYKDFYPEFFIMHGEGKRKKFDETGYQVLHDIRELREEKKLDWMEIREHLEQQFKDLLGQEEEKAIAEQQQKLVTQANARLDHLGHLFTALTGEVVKIGAQARKLEQQQLGQSRMMIKLQKSYERLHHDVELLIMETVNRTDANRKAVKEVGADQQAHIQEIRAQFSDIRKGMENLAVRMRTLPSSPPPVASGSPARAEDLQQLLTKIDKLSEEGALNQSKYHVLLRENELLKNKLRDASRMQEEEEFSDKPRKGGLLGMFRKE